MPGKGVIIYQNLYQSQWLYEPNDEGLLWCSRSYSSWELTPGGKCMQACLPCFRGHAQVGVVRHALRVPLLHQPPCQPFFPLFLILGWLEPQSFAMVVPPPPRSPPLFHLVFCPLTSSFFLLLWCLFSCFQIIKIIFASETEWTNQFFFFTRERWLNIYVGKTRMSIAWEEESDQVSCRLEFVFSLQKEFVFHYHCL